MKSIFTLLVGVLLSGEMHVDKSAPLPAAPRAAGPLRAQAASRQQRQPLRTTVAGHVERVLFSENQLVRRGDILLKMSVGSQLAPTILYLHAPADGRIIAHDLQVGDYLPAQTQYAQLIVVAPVPTAAAMVPAGPGIR